MRKILLLLLLALAATGCRRDLFGNHFRAGGGRPPKRPPAPVALPEGAAVWATAVAFHDTTDWRAGASGGAGLLLFKNGIKVDSLSGNFLKPEQHRFREGALWTNDTDGFRSYIRRDGELFCSYEGEEAMAGFLLENGRVHTLGQRPGGGFTYRIDGKAVYTSAQGLVLGSGSDEDWEGGALCLDGSGVYYTWGILQQSAADPVWEYRLMRGNDIWKVITPPSGGLLFDLRVWGGTCYRVERRYDRNCLLEDEEIRVLRARGNQDELKLVPSFDAGIAVIGNTLMGSARMGWLEQADGNYFQYLHHGGGALRLWVRDGTITSALMDPQGCLSGVRAGATEISFPSGTFRLQHKRCAAFFDRTLALALTATSGNDHLFWVGGEETPVSFNGYFTGIYIE